MPIHGFANAKSQKPIFISKILEIVCNIDIIWKGKINFCTNFKIKGIHPSHYVLNI